MTEKKITRKDIFKTLSKIDVSKYVEKVPGKKDEKDLSYLSWAHALSILMDHFPNVEGPIWKEYPEMVLQTKDIRSREGKLIRKEFQGYTMTERMVPYLTTSTGTMVTCTMIVEGIEFTESLHVMNFRRATDINPDMGLINKTQKRCMAKCIAKMGLGLNLYAGEDIPMGDLFDEDRHQKLLNQSMDTWTRLVEKYEGQKTPDTLSNEIKKISAKREGFGDSKDGDLKIKIAVMSEMLKKAGITSDQQKLDGVGA